MLRRYLILAGLISFTAALIATNIPSQPSGEEPTKEMDAFLSQWDKNDMPGCALGVIKDGKLIYNRALELANLDYDVPNTITTLFNLASASKPFAAASIVLLAQQGKLSLQDDIRKYVPELPQ